MSAAPPVASVVVRTYQRPALLARCLAALAAEPEAPAFEVIVVDDGSPGRETAEVVAAILAAGAGVRFVRHAVNRGRSAAANTGIREAAGEIVMLVDDDVVVEPGYVAAHVAAHRAAEPARVAVVGNLRFPPDVVRVSNYARYLQSRYLGGRSRLELARLGPSDLHPRFLLGAVASVRRDDAIVAGLFDEVVRFYGCEDHLFGDALRANGIRIVFAPGARAWHHDPVALDWYRAKLQEAARDGVPALLAVAPEFLEDSAYRALLPIAWARDRGAPLARKIALRAILNPLSIRVLDYWAGATDRRPGLYSPAICRALSAGWFLQGLRMPRGGDTLVVYGR